MKHSLITHIFIGIATLMALASQLYAKEKPHIAYAFPAIISASGNFKITLGGQGLRDAKAILCSHPDSKAKILSYQRYISKKDMNQLKNRLDNLEDKLKKATNSQQKKELQKKLQRQQFIFDHRVPMPTEANDIEHMKRIQKKRQPNDQLLDRLDIQFTKLPDTELTPIELRVLTPQGLTPPFQVYHSNHPSSFEQEPNDLLREAQAIPETTQLLQGQIMPGDTDVFAFQLQAGESLQLSLWAKKIKPLLADAVPGWFQAILSLSDQQGRELAFSDDIKSHPDPALHYLSPIQQTVLLEIRDAIYRGREDFVYALHVQRRQRTPAKNGQTNTSQLDQTNMDIATHIYPLGGQKGKEAIVQWKSLNDQVHQDTLQVPVSSKLSPQDLQPWHPSLSPITFEASDTTSLMENQLQPKHQPFVNLPCIIDGRIDGKDQIDVFHFKVQSGDRWVFEIKARSLGSPLDAELMLMDQHGQILARSDDHQIFSQGINTHQADPKIDHSFSISGNYHIILRDINRTGSPFHAYRLHIRQAKPQQDISIYPSQMLLKTYKKQSFTVHWQASENAPDSITLHYPNAPEGLVLSGNVLNSGNHLHKLHITLKKNLPKNFIQHPQPFLFTATTSTHTQDTIQHRVHHGEYQMQAFLNQHFTPSQRAYLTFSNSSKKKRNKK